MAYSHHVAAQLKALDSASRSTLQALWIKHFGAPPVFRAHNDLLRIALAYRVQEKLERGLTEATSRRLEAIAQRFEHGRPAKPARSQFKAGTRLIREWRGETHVASIVEDGVEYRAKRYSSLSEVARLITGTRWSGPAFFGLKSNTKAAGRETA